MIHISWAGIIGGVLVMLIGLYLSTYQFSSGIVGDAFGRLILEYASPEFLRWLSLLGILLTIRGAYLSVTSVFVQSTIVGRMLVIGGQVLSAMAIPLLVWLREHIELLPIVSLRSGEMVVRFPQSELAGLLRWSLNGVIALLILGIAIALIRLLTDSQLNMSTG